MAAANGRGVVGVAFRAKLMTVKVLDDQGAGTTGAVAEGIRYAAANGARIINLSLEGNTDDPRMRAAVEAAAAANVLLVCSAGNSGIDVDRQPVYPVAIAAPNVVGVAATEPDEGRGLPDFSNYGRLTVPVAAPGVEVISTPPTAATSQVGHVDGRAARGGPRRADGFRRTQPARGRTARAAAPARGAPAVPVGAGYVDALGAVLAARRRRRSRRWPAAADPASSARAGAGT